MCRKTANNIITIIISKRIFSKIIDLITYLPQDGSTLSTDYYEFFGDWKIDTPYRICKLLHNDNKNKLY